MKEYKDFKEFWPFYVLEHSQKGTRLLHFIGTTMLFLFVALAFRNASPLFLLAGIVSAYGCAWAGHFVIEKNRPATFQYPLLSLMGDFKMYALMLTGKMGTEVEKMKLRAS